MLNDCELCELDMHTCFTCGAFTKHNDFGSCGECTDEMIDETV